MISIETQGLPYERGIQHGSQCAALICTIISAYDAKGKLSFDARPALRKIERCFPAMIEEMEGIADGAQLSRDEVFRLNLQQLEAAPCCSVIGVCDQNGNPWIAKTDDIGEDELGWNILQHATNVDGTSSLFLHFAGTVWFSTAVVENGFCMAMTGLPGDAGPAQGIPWITFLSMIPACCNTVEEAETLLSKFDLEYGGFSLLLADANRNAMLIEKTSQGQAIRQLKSEIGVLCHTNHCCFEALSDPPNFNNTPLADNSRARLEVLWRLASEYSHSCDGLQKLLRDHTQPDGICQHGEAGLHTDYSVVLSPMLRGLWLSAGPACNNTFQFHPVTRTKAAHANVH